MNANEFGGYLKSLRTERKLTIRQLEELSGVSNSFISQLERGERKASPDVLKKLAKPLYQEYPYLLFIAGYLSEEEYGLTGFLLTDDEAQDLLNKKESTRWVDSLVGNTHSSELTEILNDPNITYCNKGLGKDDRQRILDMLKLMFPDRQD